MTRRFAAGLIAFACALIAFVSAQQKPPVDDAALRAPEARNQDWLSYGRDYYEQRFSPLDQINDKNVAQLGLAWQFETATQPRPRSDAARRRRRDVRDRIVERHLRDRRAHRQAALEVRPRSASQVRQHRVLRCRQPRRRVLQGPRLRRRARWPARGDRCGERQGRLADDHRRSEPAVHDHRRAAHREGEDHHRQRRRRIRRARLCVRVRRRDRQARVALLHGARRSVEAAGEQGARCARCRRGRAATGGSTAAAARCGIRSSTTPS